MLDTSFSYLRINNRKKARCMQIENILLLMEAQDTTTSFKDTILQLMQYMGSITQSFTTNQIEEENRQKYKSRMLTRWFAQKYPDIKSYASSLRHKGPNIRKIADIPVFAQTFDSSPFTKGDGMKVFMTSLPLALREIGLIELSAQFVQQRERMNDAISGIKPQTNQPQRNQQQNQDHLRGEQQNQVEAVVNAQLASLNPELRHRARLFISKSSNKLKALQQFLDANS